MDIGRLFFNAAVRKVAYTCVALAIAALLGMCGIPNAQAGIPVTCGSGKVPMCNRAQAYAAVNVLTSGTTCPGGTYAGPIESYEHVATTGTTGNYRGVFHCKLSSNNSNFGGNAYTDREYYGSICPAGETFNPTTHTCAVTCGSKPDYTFTPGSYTPPNGAVGCTAGCATAYFNNGDGTFTGKPSVMDASCTGIPDCTALGLEAGGYSFNAYAGTCEPPEGECEKNEVKNTAGECVAACPAGKHIGPTGACESDDESCPAGQTKAPDGSCVDNECGSGRAKGNDGSCKPDSDNDGTPDDEEEGNEDGDKFSGGDSCDTPPACSGDAIQCGMARIQWRIDCNTRKDITITGGSCDQIPVCVGKNCNAMEYSQLLMQWRTSCKVDKITSGGGGDEGDDPMEPVGSGGVLGDDGYTGADVTKINDDDIEFDEGGFGYGSSCPELPDVNVFGQTVSFDTTVFCDWMKLGGIFVMIMAHIAGLAYVIRA